MEDKIYTKEEAIDLNRKEQEAILKLRKVQFTKKDKELALVSKILDSNPSKKVEVSTKEKIEITKPKIQDKKEKVSQVKKYPCEKCGSEMIITGGGHSGTDLHCPNCKANLNKVI